MISIRLFSALVVAFALSLCANAFMGGVLITHPYRSAYHERERENMGIMMDGRRDHEHEDEQERGSEREHPSEPARLPRGLIRDLGRDLPPHIREQLSATLESQREILQPHLQKLQQLRGQVRDAVAAEAFDAETLKALLTAQRSEQASLQADLHEQFIKILSGLSPMDRAALADKTGKIFR